MAAASIPRVPTRSTKPNPKNKHALYAAPLPLRTHPLPAFLPHNPLSLLRLAWALVAELVFPPVSHCTAASRPRLFSQSPEVHLAYLDPYTCSAHVTDEVAVRALWEGGFFGKGSLSRSEPEWVARVLQRREDERARRAGGRTAAEVTGKRREERREMKRRRAREEVLQVERRLREEREETVVNGDTVGSDRGPIDGKGNGRVIAEIGGHTVEKEAEEAGLRASQAMQDEEDIAAIQEEPLDAFVSPDTHALPDLEPFTNQEHLQLSPHETFFLVYALGILRVQALSMHDVLSVPSLLRQFCATSSFPPADHSALWSAPETTLASLDPDNPFLLHYAAYHYFRSLGWVTRPGIKFSADFLLYARGPVFSHAQFAIVIIPAYKDPYWTMTPQRRRRKEKAEKRDWWWFHAVNRVQSAVMKTLVLCYVEVPRPMEVDQVIGDDVGALFRRYRVRCVSCKRWTPQRNLK